MQCIATRKHSLNVFFLGLKLVFVQYLKHFWKFCFHRIRAVANKKGLSLSLSLSLHPPLSLSQRSCNSQVHRPSILRDSSHMHLYHMSYSANRNSSCSHETKHMASIKYQQIFCFRSMQSCLYIAYEVRVSLKGQSAPFSISFATSKTIFSIFQTSFKTIG